jgi:RNA polymerase sigma-70 factor (ECF subfamily)
LGDRATGVLRHEIGCGPVLGARLAPGARIWDLGPADSCESPRQNRPRDSLRSGQMGSGPATNDDNLEGRRHEELRRRLAAVYDACAGALFRYAAMILADPSAAEDVVQQVFVKLAQRGRLDDIAAVRSYVRQAVRNECYSALRRRQRMRRVADERALLEVASAPGQSPCRDEVRGVLEEALKALTPQQREVVCMKVYEKMTFGQIAAATGIPVNTAASRYRYGLAHLRQLLGGGTRSE